MGERQSRRDWLLHTKQSVHRVGNKKPIKDEKRRVGASSSCAGVCDADEAENTDSQTSRRILSAEQQKKMKSEAKMTHHDVPIGSQRHSDEAAARQYVVLAAAAAGRTHQLPAAVACSL